MENYVNLICTAILAITSVVNVLLLLYQINSNRQDEAKKFWYKVSINSDDLSNCTGYFNRIISIIENNQKRNDKLLAYKDEFKNIRNFFSKTIFFLSSKTYRNLSFSSSTVYAFSFGFSIFSSNTVKV